jgi:predicted ATPase
MPGGCISVPCATLPPVTRAGLEAVAVQDTRHVRLYRTFCLDPQGFIAEELRERGEAE